MDLSVALKYFTHLKADRSKGAVAPHKAILLLSVIQSIEAGEIIENRIYITPELVARFKDNWHLLVHDGRFNANFSLPFYHLKSEKFWTLSTKPGREILLTSSNSIRSFSTLKETVAYASFDSSLYHLLGNKTDREYLKNALLKTFLGGQFIPSDAPTMFNKIEQQILCEPVAEYRKELVMTDEEDLFVRSGVFKKTIPRIYNFTCCISGTKIISTRDIQMVDACHIVPFSESHDDTVQNGISLSPNFHRAFDRFLITIDEQFKVVVSDSFTESGAHLIKSFQGKTIQLPNDKRYYPSLENLNWHRERFLAIHGS